MLVPAAAPLRLPPWIARVLEWRWSPVGLGLLALAVTLRRLVTLPERYEDSWAPMRVALEFLDTHDAAGLFDVVFFEWGVKFQYPPSSLLLLELPYRAGIRSSLAYNGANLVALVLNAAVVGKLAATLAKGLVSAGAARTCAAAAGLAAFYYEPIRLGFSIGQVQVVLNLAFSLACLALLTGRDLWAGVAMGLATAFKPQFGPLLLVALLLGRPRFVVGFLGAALPVGLVSLAMYGLPSHLSYLRVLSFLSERGESFHWNESINGIAHRLVDSASATALVEVHGVHQSPIPAPNAAIATLTRVASAALLLLPFALFAKLRPRLDPMLGFGFAALCFVIASPIAWTHHYGILLPLYLLVARELLATGPLPARDGVLLGVSFALTALPWPELQGATGLATLLQVPVFHGACLLALVMGRRLYARSAGAPA